jgi:hypothetical protein
MQNLGDFPKFTKLDLKHKDALREIAKNFPPYSDFNFVSLFTWDKDNSVAVSELNANLVVRFSDYSDGEIFYSLLGKEKLEKSIDAIFEHCQNEGRPQELRLIGEVIINNLPVTALKKYKIEEDRDNHDYMVSADLQSDMSQFHKKKQKNYTTFMEKHADRVQARELDLTRDETIQGIKDLLLDWKDIKDRDKDDFEREFSAIYRCLSHAKELGIVAYGTFLENRLVAFTLFEVVHDKTAIAHFGKADTNIKGASEHFEHNMANFMRELGVELINNEQDLGIEGLRTSKKSYKPVGFLKKYKIRPKHQIIKKKGLLYRGRRPEMSLR